jgi:hypothetical protein
MDFIKKNKKAQSMSTNTIILLILGLLVLVFLIWGFTTQWQSVQKIITPTNVGEKITECKVDACSLASHSFSYCRGDRTLRVNEDDLVVETSCYVLANLPEFNKYGFEECSKFENECKDLSCEDIKIDGNYGDPELESGKYDVSSLVQEETCFIEE